MLVIARYDRGLSAVRQGIIEHGKEGMGRTGQGSEGQEKECKVQGTRAGQGRTELDFLGSV